MAGRRGRSNTISPTTVRRARTRVVDLLFYAELLDDAENVGSGNIVERMLVFLFKPLAEVFGANVTRFAIRRIAPRASTEFHKAGMREPQHHALSIHEKLAIHRVRMPRGDSVPAMREAAAVNVVRHLGWHVESADELAHRAGIWNRRKRCFCHVPFQRSYFRAPTAAG